VNGTLAATEKLMLRAEGVVTLAKASFDSFQMPAVSYTDETAPRAWDNDFSQVDQYSDLDYTQLDLSLGASYRLAPRTQVFAGMTYQDFVDDEPYVYGDLDGRLLIYNAGLKLDL
jgi:hypothetical protein